MKKIIFILVLVAAIGGNGLRAQDTIYLLDVRDLENYFIPPEWPRFPDDFTFNEYYEAYQVYIMFCGQNRSQMAEWGYRMLTDDTLDIYGIAAVLCPGNTMQNWLGMELTWDTSSLYAHTWLMLYDVESDTLHRLVDSSYTYVHSWQRPEHYVQFGWYNSYSGYGYPPLPLFERYFPSPVTVADSFYVGNVVPRDHPYIHSDISFPRVITEDLDNSLYQDTVDFFQRTHWKYYSSMFNTNYDYWTAGWSGEVPKTHPLIFPILSPPDTMDAPVDTITTGYLILHSGNTLVVAPGDTLVIGGDTLVVTGDTLVVTLGDTLVLGGSTFVVNPGDTLFVNPGDTLFVSPDGTVTAGPGGTFVVGSGSGTSDPGDDPGVGLRQADMLYRYTSVSPNPATQRATVTSSFGLERIEVYDPQGRQTLTLPATGYRATLDLSAWPRGTYLLRILTPLGTTTKKLLVQ